MEGDFETGYGFWRMGTKTERNTLYIDTCLHLEEFRCAILKDGRVHNGRWMTGMSIEGALCRLLTLIVMLFV